MLEGIFEEIGEWLRGLLAEMVLADLEAMYADADGQAGMIAGAVAVTPQGWNAPVYSMIRNLSDSVMMPVAGVIITYVLCYELVSMLTAKNNMHDIDTWMFFKYLVKAWIAVYLVSHTFDITLGVFEMGSRMARAAAESIRGSTAPDAAELARSLEEKMEGMGLGELFLLEIEASFVTVGTQILSALTAVILYARMVEIYLYISVAPVPFATFSNREWGQIGNNYLRGLFALAFQGFLIMACVGINAALVESVHTADDIHSALFGTAAYMALLFISLRRTKGLSQSVFNAH